MEFDEIPRNIVSRFLLREERRIAVAINNRILFSNGKWIRAYPRSTARTGSQEVNAEVDAIIPWHGVVFNDG